jgi:lipoprotein-anchoring transpeptidase ErfK/SrfK
VIPLKYHALLALSCALAACQQTDNRNKEVAQSEKAATEKRANPLVFADAEGDIPPLPETLEMMPVQIALSRLGLSPGVIDGKLGESLKIAIRGFQAANRLKETGELDEETRAALARAPSVPVTKRVTIPSAFANQQYFQDFPEDAAEQAKLPALGYRNLMEALAERFHTTPETLVALNSPDTPIGAGKTIIVPNIADAMPPRAEDRERNWGSTLAMLGVAPEQPQVARIIVDKSAGWLRAYGEDEKLIAQFPVTTGSEKDPLPLGNWTVKGVARNPDYSYDPALLRGEKKGAEKQKLKPGPNSPVGVVWIDLSKEHYGIHGTSEPATIGRAESNGCVRLTNWDAAKLAGMVKPGVKVEFVA